MQNRDRLPKLLWFEPSHACTTGSALETGFDQGREEQAWGFDNDTSLALCTNNDEAQNV